MRSLLARHLVKAKALDRLKSAKKAEKPGSYPPRPPGVEPERGQMPGDTKADTRSAVSPAGPEVSSNPGDQPRTETITFMASKSEKRTLKTFARKQGLSLSRWVRIELFRAMGQPVPEK